MTKNKKNRGKNLQLKINDDEQEDLSDSPTLTDCDSTILSENIEKKENSTEKLDILGKEESAEKLDILEKENVSLKEKVSEYEIQNKKIVDKLNKELKEKCELLEKEIDKNNLLSLENYELKNKNDEFEKKITELNDKINEQNTKLNGQSTVDLLFKLKDSLLNKNKDLENNIKSTEVEDKNNSSKNNDSEKTTKKTKRVNSLFFRHL